MAERHDVASHDNARPPTRRVFLGAAAAAGMLVPAIPALAARAAARAGTPGERAVSLTSAATIPSTPSATISAFLGPDATGTQVIFPTSGYHSQWLTFQSVVGFNPSSIVNNSGSDIWVYCSESPDSPPITGPFCAFGTSLACYTFTSWLPVDGGTPDQGYVSAPYVPDMFFIQYNVNTGATQPPAPPS